MDTSIDRKPGLRAVLLTAMFYPLMIAWTLVGVVCSPALIAILAIATGWEIDRVVRYWIKVHGRGLIVIVSPFVRFRKEGLETIPLPSILVVNHLSFVDGYYMASLPFHDLTFAVGAWPFRMYWYTAFMRLARYIDVESIAWNDAVAICRRAASKNGCVLFFPEGHRSRDRRLQPFYSGAFRMAIETGLPLVPLCITGTDVLLPPGKHWLHPADVKLRALPALDPARFRGASGPTRFCNDVRERMAIALDEMRGTPCESSEGGTVS
ncbi:MAG: lysophospholipid acyltransferase family protein [Candidatus Deferrimicrobiaceae bacterium]